jgi:dUTP pyrophosphatase
MEATVWVELLPEHPSHGDPAAARQAVSPAHPGDAGIDLVACEEAVLGPGERILVSAGIRIALPAGIEAQVRPRSGQALKRGITVGNAPGTIDPGYRGPVKVILLNTAPAVTAADIAEDGQPDGSGEELRTRLAAGLAERTVRIERGDRIAQLVFSRFVRPTVEIVESVSLETTRGEGGFGSTGTT